MLMLVLPRFGGLKQLLIYQGLLFLLDRSLSYIGINIDWSLISNNNVDTNVIPKPLNGYFDIFL